MDPVLLSLLESDMDFTNETDNVTMLPNQQTNQPNAPNDTSRFIPVADADIENFIQDNENSNTRRKTLGHIKLVQSFLLSQGETRELHKIPSNELDKYLSKFLIGVRQRNGDEYQPSYLRGIFGSLERYLRRHGYGASIVSGHEFSTTKATLKSKQKALKRQGLGNRPKAADPISDADVNTLYEKGIFGGDTPMSLINTLWFNHTVHFGIRGGGEEHRRLCVGDLTLAFDSELNKEFIEYNERQTKTRTGENVNNIRTKPRMYATYDDRCPVATYKKYMDKRPENFSRPDDPFYLSVVTNNKSPREDQQWYLRLPMGKHKLSILMKKMVQEGELSESEKRLTNTSARKYLCQKLLENEIPDAQAVHVTGHKNIQSLNNYRTLNNKQQQTISALISNSNTHVASDHRPAVPLTSNSVTSPAQNNLSWNTSCMSNNPMHSLFNGATINGGNFSINMYFCSHGQAAAGTCTSDDVNKCVRDVRRDDDI